MFSEDFFSYAVCACWLLPLGLVGGVVMLLHSVRAGWRSRGLERGTLYCSSCRFNLRGSASWNCPECGAHLDDGYIMTPGHDPPVGLMGRLLLATVGVAGPMVLGCWLLAWVVPVNWEVNRSLDLRPVLDSMLLSAPISFRGDGERAFFGRGRPEVLWFNPGWGAEHRLDRNDYFLWRRESLLPLPDEDHHVVSDGDWDTLCAAYGLRGEPTEMEAARAELVLVARYMAGAGSAGPPDCEWYQVHERTYSRFDPLWWFVLLEVIIAVLAWAWLLRTVVRGHRRAWKGYAYRHDQLSDKLHGWIGENRLGAGVSTGSRVNGE